jgi:GxxExxY protein
VTQRSVLIHYKGFTREESLRLDILVENCVLVETKAVEKILPINFHEIKVTDGVSRLILAGANH